MLIAAMVSPLTRDSAIVAATTALLAGVAGAVYFVLVRRRPPMAERERMRRANLAQHGRIVAGSLLDMVPSETEPVALRYRYMIAGVSYECVQDVSTLRDFLSRPRLELPVLVRYDRANPADSMLLSEDWSGLRNGLVERHPKDVEPQN